MILHPEFLTHWKTRKLVRLLKDPCAPLYVIRIWALCQTSRNDEIPSNAETIAGICDYDNDATGLRKALVDCGFLEPQNNGTYRVHDWKNVNASLINSWKNGVKGGRPSLTASNKKPEIQHAENPIESSRENPRDTHGIPTANATREDKIREDQIRPEKIRINTNTKPEGGISPTVQKALGSILKSSGGVVPVSGSGSISFHGLGYSRGEMVKHACTGSKRGNRQSKGRLQKIEVLSDFEAMKICDEVNTIRMDDRKETGYLVGVFRKKLFISKGEE